MRARAPVPGESEALRMATVTGTKDTLDELIEGNEIVLIDFWAQTS